MTLIIIDPESDLRQRLSALLSAHFGIETVAVASTAEAVGAANGHDVRAVLMGPGVPAADAFELAKTLLDDRPDIGVVLTAADVTTELLRSALRCGCSDVVVYNESDPAELMAALDEALERSAKLRGDASEEAPDRAKVLTVLSTKGGVGKSVIASNLAVTLAQTSGKRVALVDLDLRSGDIGIMLQLKPTRTIADAAHEADRLDEELLQGFLLKHSSGAQVLLAPAQPDDAAIVTAPRLVKILDLLGSMFDFVVIDTPPILDDIVLTAVDASDLVYVVATMDVASVKDTRLTLQRLQSLGYSNGSTKLVLNRADSRVWLEPADVEKAVGTSIFVRIPSDRVVPRSVNKGVPVVIEAPRSAVSRSFAEIARLVTEQGGKG